MKQDEQSRQKLTYEGRRLPKPEEDVVDQGLGFDIATLVGRRQVLRGLALGLSTAGLAACAGGSSSTSSSSTSPSAAATPGSTTGSTSSSTEIPDETAGPYPGDGSNGPNVLDQSGIVRSDLRTSFGSANGTAEGVPITLELVVQDLAKGGAAFAGVAVYVWHCTREGGYSMYSQGVENENYLRGVQIADANGRVTFTSIFPACYDGRWPHIHFEVYPDESDIVDPSRAIATSQVALPKDACDIVYKQTGYEKSVANLSQVSLQDDNVFGDDAGVTRLGTATGSVADGYTVSLAVRIDTTTTPTNQGGGPPRR
jgi:protocatechuate 3,4-dioxygenase beta subunit